MNYEIEAHESFEDLVIAVNKRIKDGWQPIGGVSHVYDGQIDWTCQSLIKQGKE